MFPGLLCDLLWSDPDKDVQGWGENDRGVSFTFGADVVSKFLNRHDLDLICRAHQVNFEDFFFDQGGHGQRTPNEAFFHRNPKLLGLDRQFRQIYLQKTKPLSKCNQISGLE